MKDFVEKLELDNYLSDEPTDPLAKMLDAIIKANEVVSPD